MLRPLSITQVDWKTFINTCQDSLGYSPTRGLDKCGMKVEGAEAFLACIDLENRPREALKNPLLFQHIQASFIGELPDDVLVELVSYNAGNIGAVVKDLRRGKLVILTANLYTWYWLCVEVCSEQASYDLRVECNGVVVQLEKAGFRIFTRYTKKILTDETFILCSK